MSDGPGGGPFSRGEDAARELTGLDQHQVCSLDLRVPVVTLPTWATLGLDHFRRRLTCGSASLDRSSCALIPTGRRLAVGPSALVQRRAVPRQACLNGSPLSRRRIGDRGQMQLPPFPEELTFAMPSTGTHRDSGTH